MTFADKILILCICFNCEPKCIVKLSSRTGESETQRFPELIIGSGGMGAKGEFLQLKSNLT